VTRDGLSRDQCGALGRVVANSCHWLLPWFCILLVSAVFAYGVDMIICSDQPGRRPAQVSHAGVVDEPSAVVLPRSSVGSGIAPERDPQTSAQLRTAQSQAECLAVNAASRCIG